MARTRNQDNLTPDTPTPRGRVKATPKRIVLKQTRTKDNNEVHIEPLKQWVDWSMPLFKLLRAATVKEEWLGMLLELFREIFWRFRDLPKEVLTQIIQGAQPDTPGVIWAPDYCSHAEKIMRDIQANVCQCNGAAAPSTFPGAKHVSRVMFPGLPNYPRWVGWIAGHAGLAG